MSFGSERLCLLDFVIDESNNDVYESKLNWYIGSTSASAYSVKYSKVALSAVGAYAAAVFSICLPVFSATFKLAETSSLVAFEYVRESMSSILSNRDPVALLSKSKIKSSSSTSFRLPLATLTTRSFFSESRSGRSRLTTRSRSCALSPCSFTVKFITASFVLISGV